MGSLKVSILFLCISLLLIPGTNLIAIQDPGVSYLRYDVDIILQENGDFRIREIQQVRYNGEYSEGFAEIPLDYVTDISNIAVFASINEDNLSAYEFDGFGPGSYSVEREGNTLYIDWEYEQTKPGDELIFVVEYLVEGGIWIYPEADFLEWHAVSADRSGLAVPSSRVTVNIPFAIDPDEIGYSAIGPSFNSDITPTTEGLKIEFNTAEILADGTPFQVLVELPHGLVENVAQPWQIAEDQASLKYRIPSVDVDLILNENGTLEVTEVQTVAVDEGTLYEGFRRFTWLYLEGLNNVYVREGDTDFNYVEEASTLACDDCFTMSFEGRPAYWVSYSHYSDKIDINERNAGGGEILWRVPPLVKGEETSFTLSYEADGVISVDENQQRLYWTILPGYDVPVGQTNVRLFLPNGLGLEDISIDSEGDWEAVEDYIQLTLDESAAEWTINVTLPANATSAEKPAWQFEMEEVFAEAEQTRTRLAQEQLLFRSMGMLTIVLLSLGGLAVWYLIGSRKVRELRGQYRTKPPSDLAPGLVAYLVDEKATAIGALATLLHLAILGLIRIDMTEGMMLELTPATQKVSGGAKISTPTGNKTRIESHSAYLYNYLASKLPLGEKETIEKALEMMGNILPQLYTKMSQDLINLYYSNGNLRNKRHLPGLVYFVIFALIFIIFYFFRNIWYRLFISPPPDMGRVIVIMVIAAFAYLAYRLVRSYQSNSITKAGKEESKRWLGFKAYLNDIKNYGDLAGAQEILDRYFDYAVALRVDERFLEQVQSMGVLVPVWIQGNRRDKGELGWSKTKRNPWYYRPWYRRGSWSASPTIGAGTSKGVKPASAPDSEPMLQQVSNNLTSSLSRANDSMVNILNTASGTGGEAVAVEINAFGSKTKIDWEPGTPMDKVIGDIMRKSQTIRPPRSSSSTGGGFRSGSGGSRSRSSSRSRSRSSSSRRSGGGGRRGFR